MVGLPKQPQLVSVPSPLHDLARNKNVQKAEPHEVQEENDCRQMVAGPIKDGGFD